MKKKYIVIGIGVLLVLSGIVLIKPPHPPVSCSSICHAKVQSVVHKIDNVIQSTDTYIYETAGQKRLIEIDKTGSPGTRITYNYNDHSNPPTVIVSV